MAYYQRGAGTDSDAEDYVFGGFTGSDVAEHVREAYSMVANNFNPETQQELVQGSGEIDEIVLLGFSRGAFTARAIASLISDIGLLTKIVGTKGAWGELGVSLGTCPESKPFLIAVHLLTRPVSRGWKSFGAFSRTLSIKMFLGRNVNGSRRSSQILGRILDLLIQSIRTS